MNTISSIMASLKRKGYRMTKVRRALLELFDSSSPLDVPTLSSQLAAQGLFPNKTTIYRELQSLVKENILSELDFMAGKKHYEKKLAHHHHLVCTNCDTVLCVELPQHLHQIEHALERENNFVIQQHHLEFFGLCSDCQ